MEQQLHGFKYFLYDFESNLARRMNQPSKYGIDFYSIDPIFYVKVSY